jgi:hypothetical protein
LTQIQAGRHFGALLKQFHELAVQNFLFLRQYENCFSDTRQITSRFLQECAAVIKLDQLFEKSEAPAVTLESCRRALLSLCIDMQLSAIIVHRTEKGRKWKRLQYWNQ